MASQKSRPHRALNSRISFNPLVFRQKLLGALNGVDEAIGANFECGKPFEDWLDPSWGHHPGDFGVNYLLGQMLSKYDDGKPSPEKQQRTWDRFAQAERSCKRTNMSLQHGWGRWSNTGFSGTTLHSVLHTAKLKILSVLGDFCWNEAADGFSWGPGSTTRLARRRSDAVYKFMGHPHTTAGNLAAARAAILSSPLWAKEMEANQRCLEIVPGSKVITVPKNYKADRCIAVEPDMNMFVQKGIGSMIRRRLKRRGVDLDNQALNQDAAFIASKFENLATVDLAMASDTVSYETVRALLPPDWADAMELCRSEYGVLPSGELHLFQKWSSMGNGYTFELESLIFWAISASVLELFDIADRRLNVYGDDIVISVEAVEHLTWALTGFGFDVNVDKTHSDGPFRESCGSHFYKAFNVTPIYLRGPVRTLMDLFLLHNNLKRWIARNGWNPNLKLVDLNDLLLWIRGFAPREWRRPRIPDGVGDGAFIGSFSECRPGACRSSHKLGHGHEGYDVPILIEATKLRKSHLYGQLLRALHRPQWSPLDYLNPTTSVSGVPQGTVVRRVYLRIAQWPNELM